MMSKPAQSSRASRSYCPIGAAASLFYCKDAEILIEGPAGTGKTRGVLEKVHLCLLKYAGARALITRKTRASMTESVLVTFEEKVVPPRSPMVSNQLRRVRQSYDYPNSSALVVCGMDNPDRIMSTEYDLIAAFESTELTEDDWEKLTTRLRNGVMPYQQAIADCNPSNPSHWLNQRAGRAYKVPEGMESYLPAARAGQTQMTRLLSRHRDNPTLWDVKANGWTPQGARYIASLNHLTGARYQRLLAGKWAAAEGLVYDGFDPTVHVVKPFEIPADWRRIRSVDFGLRNPFVCQWWAIDHDGRMYLYREIYMTERLSDRHAEDMNKLSESESIEATVSDHSLDDRDMLHNAGIHTIAAYKGVQPGIQAVCARLVPGEDKKPRLMIFDGARVERDDALERSKKPTCTVEEFDGYVYAQGVDGKPVKEEPVKMNDHGMDAMRYAVAYVDDVGGQDFEFIAGSAAVLP